MQRILVYGDSNSHGTAPLERLGDRAVHPRGVRWPDVMTSALGEGWEVIVEGLPGRTAVLDDPMEGAYRNGLTVLPAILHSHRPIDLLIVALGTNDKKARFGLSGQDVALGIARLLREARASETVSAMLALCPPPVQERGELAEMFRGAEARAGDLPAQLARFAAAEGATFFDAGRVISADPLDGVHWSAASHATLGAALAAEVRKLVTAV